MFFVFSLFLSCSNNKKVDISSKEHKINTQTSENILLKEEAIENDNDISFLKGNIRIFSLKNLTIEIYETPELYRGNPEYQVTESKASGNSAPTGWLTDDDVTVVEVLNEKIKIYYWEKEGEYQIRRVIINMETDESPLGKYIGQSTDDIIKTFGKPVGQDGAFNGDWGTLYYGIADGKGSDYGDCQVFFSHKNYIINKITYGYAIILMKDDFD
jgi:hypothetical protein